MSISHRRHICFVTGTRAEFGLMRTTLAAIAGHPALKLSLIVTGMHLSRRHGYSLDQILADGFRPAATVAWPQPAKPSPQTNARATGKAITGLADVFARLSPDVVLVVGDRVEAFAAATAAHLSHIPLAHIHGGDRAQGQVDDSLRHAITKLAHIHFPATDESAHRLRRLGEDDWRIHCVGTPGNDEIIRLAAPARVITGHFPGLRRRNYALLVLHPASADDVVEHDRAQLVLSATGQAGVDRIVLIYPNNDPGSAGIIRCWTEQAAQTGITICRDVPRGLFLGLMRDSACLVGNSSSGVIEAATFHTPVVDIGPRQAGRQHSDNLVHCDYNRRSITKAVAAIWNHGRPSRLRGVNVYGGNHAGKRIAGVLASLPLARSLLGKVICY